MTQPNSIIPLIHFGGTGAVSPGKPACSARLIPAPVTGASAAPVTGTRGLGLVAAGEEQQDRACGIIGKGKEKRCQLASSSSFPSPTR